MPGSILTLDSVTYRRNGVDILRGIDLTVGEGEHWVMLGENGSGKSTALALCGARAHPTSGTVDILGMRVGRVDLSHLRTFIGHVDPRHPLRGAPTALDVVLTGLTGTIEAPMRWSPSDEEVDRARTMLADMGMASRIGARWPTLSQGERGRTLIARALISSPRLLLLDEPTTGLDLAAREQLLDTMDALTVTSLLVTHHVEEIPSTTTHAALLRDGRVSASGRIGSVLTDTNLTAAFDYPIRLVRDEGRWGARRATAQQGRTAFSETGPQSPQGGLGCHGPTSPTTS